MRRGESSASGVMDTDEGWTGETAEVGGGSRQATNRGVEPLGIELPVLGGAVDDLVAVGPTSLPIPRKICEKIWVLPPSLDSSNSCMFTRSDMEGSS